MAAENQVRECLAALKSLRRDEGARIFPNTSAAISSSIVSQRSPKDTVLEPPTPASAGPEGSDDDLGMDLAMAALETGKVAFDAREWNEAEAILQDAVQMLIQLPGQQRVFCDVFALHYRLAVCAFHTQEPTIAEQALMSFAQQRVRSEDSKHQVYCYDVAHLLSLLYIRTGQIDFARSECERALGGRRRYLGKHSEAALESTALIAHIYALLNNQARAKACLAMIPDARRNEVGKSVEASLYTTSQYPNSQSDLVRTHSDDTTSVVESVTSASSDTTSVHSALMKNRCYGPVSARISQYLPEPARYTLCKGNGLESISSITLTSVSSDDERGGLRHIPMERRPSSHDQSPEKEACRSSVVEVVPVREVAKPNVASPNPGLARQTILRNLRCMPVDRIEEAVCNGDNTSLDMLLQKKKNGGSLRSKVQKALHSKRVTALHFAALFGEIEMAGRLLQTGFDINEVPELSTSRLTPLKFALGARQVDMVDFLIKNGAKPIEPDTWSTLIGHLMNRSWITSTMSVAEREDVYQAPNRMIAIMRIWLKHGWNVNAACDASSGRRALHQAVAFESGFYKWDSNLRITMTRFLCEQGADPLIIDAKGNTAYDMASVVNDQDLLPVLEQRLERQRLDQKISGLAELSAEVPGPVELFDRSTTVPAKPANVEVRPNVQFLQELDGTQELRPR